MDQVHNIRCKEPINEIRASKRVLVVTFQDKICVYNACTFKERFCITGCFPVSGPNVNPIALHTRWLAFADKALFPVHQTRGGVAGEGTQSYTATVIHAAKTLGKGLSLFSETVASSLTGHKAPSTTTSSKKECHRMGGAMSGGLGGVVGASTSLCPGVVSVVDVLGVSTGSFGTEEDSDTEGWWRTSRRTMGSRCRRCTSTRVACSCSRPTVWVITSTCFTSCPTQVDLPSAASSICTPSTGVTLRLRYKMWRSRWTVGGSQ
uniref:BCAS3 WD40 domain-containing protein n=1 Tax=Rhipicephalus microplus TaxID=6941 RepID=A0A6G5ACI1_RHIMP